MYTIERSDFGTPAAGLPIPEPGALETLKGATALAQQYAIACLAPTVRVRDGAGKLVAEFAAGGARVGP